VSAKTQNTKTSQLILQDSGGSSGGKRVGVSQASGFASADWLLCLHNKPDGAGSSQVSCGLCSRGRVGSRILISLGNSCVSTC
jgi:hypothetical protein